MNHSATSLPKYAKGVEFCTLALAEFRVYTTIYVREAASGKSLSQL